MCHVYFIQSLTFSNWVYVGSTSNLEKRLKQHNSGQVRSTKSKVPFKLIYKEDYKNIKEARIRERELKTSRSKKDDILKKVVNI